MENEIKYTQCSTSKITGCISPSLLPDALSYFPMVIRIGRAGVRVGGWGSLVLTAGDFLQQPGGRCTKVSIPGPHPVPPLTWLAAVTGPGEPGTRQVPLSTCSDALPGHLPVSARGWHPRHSKGRGGRASTARGGELITSQAQVWSSQRIWSPPTSFRNKRAPARLSVTDPGISKMKKAC